MKMHFISIITLAATATALCTISSCTRAERIAGQWQGNPERLIAVPGASDATATVAIDFAPSPDKSGIGTVYLSAVMDVEQSLTDVAGGLDRPYEASVAATASMTGTYAYESADDDDIVVTLDPASMQVFVDPSGVSFSQNALTGLQQPVLDSLTALTAEHWRAALEPAMREVFNRYRKISDIKVHHDDIMSCEVADRDYTFRRVGVPD